MHFQGEEGTLRPQSFSQHQGVPGCCSWGVCDLWATRGPTLGVCCNCCNFTRRPWNALGLLPSVWPGRSQWSWCWWDEVAAWQRFRSELRLAFLPSWRLKRIRRNILVSSTPDWNYCKSICRSGPPQHSKACDLQPGARHGAVLELEEWDPWHCRHTGRAWLELQRISRFCRLFRVILVAWSDWSQAAQNSENHVRYAPSCPCIGCKQRRTQVGNNVS